MLRERIDHKTTTQPTLRFSMNCAFNADTEMRVRERERGGGDQHTLSGGDEAGGGEFVTSGVQRESQS